MLKEVPQDLPPMNRAQRKAWDKLTKSAAFQKASPYRQAVELHRKGLGFMVPKDVYADVSIPNLAPIALLNDCRPWPSTWQRCGPWKSASSWPMKSKRPKTR
jgi:hypothetical protein